MARVIISFLGSPREGDYPPTVYGFPSGDRQAAHVFAVALARHLQAVGTRAARIAVFGTSGSSWGTLRYLPDSPDLDQIWDEAERRSLRGVASVDASLLAQLTGRLQAALGGAAGGSQVHLQLMDEARTPESQLKLLEQMAAQVQKGDELWLDVTHGYRHLPMIGLMSALHLMVTRGVKLQGIWYGAFEMRGGGNEAPALDLQALADLGRWIAAVGAFSSSGDVRMLADCLEAGGAAKALADELRKAASLEQRGDLSKAVAAWRTVQRELGRAPLPGPAELLRRELLDRMAWAQGSDDGSQMMALARQRAEQGRFMEALVLGVEARVAHELGGRAAAVDDRKAVRQRLVGGPPLPRDLDRSRLEARLKAEPDLRHKLVNAMRNAVVHSEVDEAPLVKALLRDPERLREVLLVALQLPGR
jgi:CRISPR-associated Csx2 family protein